MVTCKSCKKEKPAQDFYKNRNKLNGLQSFCKLCHIKSMTNPYEYTPEEVPIYLDMELFNEVKKEYELRMRE